MGQSLDNPPPDRQLVHDAQAGDVAAFEQIVRQHQNRVVALALALTRSWSDAQDLTQEVFIRAWTRLETLTDPAALSAWLRRITYRTCLNFLESRGAYEARHMAHFDDVRELIAEESVERPLEVRQTADRVLSAISALAPRYRIPLTLFHLRGIATDEIALFLDLPVGTVKSLLSRGRALVREAVCIEPEGPESEVLTMVGDELHVYELPEDFAALVAATIRAVESGDLERLEALLAHRPELVNERSGPYKWPPLHFASTSGRQAVAELLLRRGADVQQRCEGDRATALHFAAECGHLETVKLLVEAGCDVNQSDNNHERGPLGWATALHAYRPEVAEYLLGKGAKHDIFTAVAMNDADAVRELVAQDASCLVQRMSKNEGKQTALHFAVRRGLTDMVGSLTALGADPTLTDAGGRVAVEFAALGAGDREARVRMVQSLRPPGRRGEWLTAIAAEDLRAMVELSVAGGRPDSDLLGFAVETGNSDVCQALLDAGADPDARILGHLSYTSLMVASCRGDHAMIEVLLRAGADMQAEDDDVHARPAVHGAWNGHIDLLDVYRKHRPVTGPGSDWAKELLRSCDTGATGEFEKWGCRCSPEQWAELGARLRALGVEPAPTGA